MKSSKRRSKIQTTVEIPVQLVDTSFSQQENLATTNVTQLPPPIAIAENDEENHSDILNGIELSNLFCCVILHFLIIFIILDVNLISNEIEQENVFPYEDVVTIQPSTPLPKFLSKDRHSKKFVFNLSKFDYNIIIEKLQLNDKEYVYQLSWKQFNRLSTKLMKSFYSTLSTFYQYGLSSKFRRNFCAVVASKLPYCEKMYQRIRKKSEKGLLSPDLTGNVKSLTSYNVNFLTIV